MHRESVDMNETRSRYVSIVRNALLVKGEVFYQRRPEIVTVDLYNWMYIEILYECPRHRIGMASLACTFKIGRSGGEFGLTNIVVSHMLSCYSMGTESNLRHRPALYDIR